VATLAALVPLAATGCELAVSDTLPLYSCVPGMADVCPLGMTCDPDTRVCARPGVGAGADASFEGDGGAGSDATDIGRADAHASDGDTGVSANHDGSADAQSAPPDGDVGTGDSSTCDTLGCRCSGGVDCASQVCASQQAVTTPIWDAAGDRGFCTQPCCTSADCLSGVCFASGVGGNYCVMPGWLPGRSVTLGKSLGGATCQANSDCRSGLCVAGTCADTCCSATSTTGVCAAGATCHIGAVPGTGFDTHTAAICGPPVSCSGFQCSRPCRNSGECGAGQACYYLPALPSKDIVAACTSGDGPATEGSKCTTDFTCATNYCDTHSMQCSDVCFANGDCTVDGWFCRPAMVSLASGGSDSVLTCGGP
jgi:hypothetical protein